MSVPATPRRSRRSAVVLVAVLAALIAAVVIIGFVTAGAAGRSSTPTPTVPAATATPTATASQSASASPSPSPTASRTAAPTKSASPTPQPTKTAAISSQAPIVKALTAKVTKTEAVQGTANGPGEIAGPSIRFTIAISDQTGKSVRLSDAVVNTYFGPDQNPAITLSGPGAKPFPDSVKTGSTATGVFVFNVPKAQRKAITVTVDTSTSNPVIAFKGSVPE